MTSLILHHDYKPKYYRPKDVLVITADHLYRFYGVVTARSITGTKAIADMWSTRCPIKANGLVEENMPQGAFKDLVSCLHFADD